MWVFTSKGFISAVRHRNKPDDFMIRARRQEHLKALFPGKQVTQLNNADYKYRVTVSDGDFKEMMLGEINALTYDNFKKSIPDAEYHDACSDVWQVMHRLQPGSYMPALFQSDQERDHSPADYPTCQDCGSFAFESYIEQGEEKLICEDCGEQHQEGRAWITAIAQHEADQARLWPDLPWDDGASDQLPAGLE